MAFRVPTQLPQRRQSYSNARRPPVLQTTPSTTQQELEESREWVLFSPTQPQSTTTRTHTTSTDRTPRTAGLSRLSDFGSLASAARSIDAEDDYNDDDDDDDILEDDTTELDSLDDGLHAFREPPVYTTRSDALHQSDPAILPAHDGLGTFPASSQNVQAQLWQHEQFNPRRRGEMMRPRRRSSVQRHLETVNELQVQNEEREKWQRIERWRMEQSKALLQEIERETRRRRNSRASCASERFVARQTNSSTTTGQRSQSDVNNDTVPAVERGERTVEQEQEQELEQEQEQEQVDPNESFWRRITRKVIRDLIGIDDSLLCVIFGEALVEEDDGEKQEQLDEQQVDAAQPAQKKQKSNPSQEDVDEMMKDITAAPADEYWWQERLLERIARELDSLVHRIYEHPDALSTYLHSNEAISNQYAGIPISRPPGQSPATSLRPAAPSRSTSTNSMNPLTSTHSPQFIPTLQDAATYRHEALWGIEEERPTTNDPQLNRSSDPISEAARLEREREYWERELDVKMVFNFLRNRFGTRNNTRRCSSSATNSTLSQQQQDPSHRAAIIRQHHPLVARAHARSQSQPQRPSLLHTRSSSSANVNHTPLFRYQHQFPRAASSCASQSTKVSVSTRRTIGGASGSSSRHYWDIGGSVGSGSAIVPAVGGAAGMGSWGDV
ncbi:hypothetical protein AJ80_08098 [Polytolypa hystricis UAMH7299]|uniref:Uncharacterized protein n=1 Tax=Polytolypa hystricis (strain UAMH7299) TaxID=1447883 RepID=A0A2B7XCY8_POLH7|nr:hypothetical protein AJ80_08098 [Polytolypa hystricis UAMH7299]